MTDGKKDGRARKQPPRHVYIVSRPGNGMVSATYTKPTIFVGETCAKYRLTDWVKTRATR